MTICSKHQIEVRRYTGTARSGKEYDFLACPKRLAGGLFCKAPFEDAPTPEASKPVQNLSNNSKNSMLQCNAMNNSIALLVSGRIEEKDLETSYRKILRILTND